MEVALRQRLEGVDRIGISQSEQTTEVVFSPGDHPFSLESFKSALQVAKVEVVTVDVEVCGQLARDGDAWTLRAAGTEFSLRDAPDAPEQGPVCVEGRLEEGAGRLDLLVRRLDAGD